MTEIPTQFSEFPEENNNEPTTPAGRVCRLLSQNDTPLEETFNKYHVFTQMDILIDYEGKQGWKEVNRWLKYEETVESGNRWSKPHVATNKMRALTKLRRIFSSREICVVDLDADTGVPDTPVDVIDAIVSILNGKLSDVVIQQIKELIFLPHKHQNRGSKSKQTSNNQHLTQRLNSSDEEILQNGKKFDDSKLTKKLLRRRSGDGKNIAAQYYKYPPGTNPKNLDAYKSNKNLEKKLPTDCETANILVGQVSFIEKTMALFCRLKTSQKIDDLCEVQLPMKFMFLLLGSTKTSNRWELIEIGKAMGTLFSDKIFVAVAHQATNREDLLYGIDEFIDDCTVVPPSVWDPNLHIAPPLQSVHMDKIKQRLNDADREALIPIAPEQEEGSTDDPTLSRTGVLFGGLIKDIKSRYRFYLSDFTDALCIQTIASTIFLFFACITPIVTFGGLMGQKTEGFMGTMETLMAGAICGFIYALFAGQPLTIIGATGPLLIFEAIIYTLCKENNFDFLSFRFWIGAWITLFLLIIVAFDLSFLVRYITRFTEESFSLLISAIFIYEAFLKVFEIYVKNPVHTGIIKEAPNFICKCFANFNLLKLDSENITSLNNESKPSYFVENCRLWDSSIEVRRGCISEDSCLHINGTLLGEACFNNRVTNSVSDVFFLSVIIFLGTFLTAIFFRNFKATTYFPTIIRSTFSDFAVLIAIIIFTSLDYLIGISTPKLSVPSTFATTRPDRTWIVNPTNVTYWWISLAAIVPSLIAIVLIFLDQQITAVIINRKEHKLRKGHGYHLDMFVLSITILISSILGLPWFVAATVRSLTHVKSLCYDSNVSTPGEKPQMIGVREQRVTGILIHILIGCSTLITVVLKLIPMPVLYGIFLYMGVTSLSGVQFVDRISILFMPVKYQPDYVYLRHVRTLRVYAFTIIQIICFATLWAVKTIKQIAIAFPLMLIFLMATRKLLDFVFSQGDLYWLDHLLPEEIRRHKEDEKKNQNINEVKKNIH